MLVVQCSHVPCDTAQQVSFHTSSRLARYSPLKVGLIVEDSGEIANDALKMGQHVDMPPTTVLTL